MKWLFEKKKETFYFAIIIIKNNNNNNIKKCETGSKPFKRSST